MCVDGEMDDCVYGGWYVEMSDFRGEISMRKWISVDGGWYVEMDECVDGGWYVEMDNCVYGGWYVELGKW